MKYVSQKTMFGWKRVAKKKDFMVSTILNTSVPLTMEGKKESCLTGFAVKAFVDRGYIHSMESMSSIADKSLHCLFRFDNQTGFDFTPFSFMESNGKPFNCELLSLAPINRLYVNPVTRQLNIITDTADVVPRDVFINTILFYRVVFGKSGASPSILANAETLIAMNDSLNAAKNSIQRLVLRERKNILQRNNSLEKRSVSRTRSRSNSRASQKRSNSASQKRSNSASQKRSSSDSQKRSSSASRASQNVQAFEM